MFSFTMILLYKGGKYTVPIYDRKLRFTHVQ